MPSMVAMTPFGLSSHSPFRLMYASLTHIEQEAEPSDDVYNVPISVEHLRQVEAPSSEYLPVGQISSRRSRVWCCAKRSEGHNR